MAKYTKYFVGREELLNRLEVLNNSKEQISQNVRSLDKPLVVTLLGSPRTGKTSIAQGLCDFLKKCGLNVSFLEEPAGAIYKTFKNDNQKREALSDMNEFCGSLIDHAFGRLEDLKNVGGGQT